MKKSLPIQLILVLSILFSCDKKPPTEPVEGPFADNSLMNLSFEQVDEIGKLRNWYTYGKGFVIQTDSSTAMRGKQSLRFKHVEGTAWAYAYSTFPVYEALGKTLTLSGYIKTSGVVKGMASLWMRTNGPDSELLAYINQGENAVMRTVGWDRYEIELYIDSSTVEITFGVLTGPDGMAWFDALSFKIDDELYDDPDLFLINSSELNWLTSNVQQFESENPEYGNSDLAFLPEIIGSSRIAALGEATRGTREFFRMKHRIVKFLAEKMGFTIFAIEANMPECRAINNYVLHGEGVLEAALMGIQSWTLLTQEVLDMIEWMREFNASGKGPVQFMGFDMQIPDLAIENVKSGILNVEPDIYQTVCAKYDTVLSIKGREQRGYYNQENSPALQKWQNEAAWVYNYLSENREKYLAAITAAEVAELIRDARVVFQSARLDKRDEYMAENVEWILAQAPAEARMILWAHNTLVSKNVPRMGSFLDEAFGNEMKVVGFCFNEGTYTAYGVNGVDAYGTSLSVPGSIEETFSQTGLPRFFFDFSKASPNDLNSAWLFKPLFHRNIGFNTVQNAFLLTELTNEYDALIYFEKTNPSTILL